MEKLAGHYSNFYLIYIMFGNVVVMTTFEGYLIINLPVSISGIQIIREIEEIRSYYERIWSAHS